MARALAREPVPAAGNSAKAWRRSWMLGYCSAVVARIRAAEEAAVAAAAPAADDAAAPAGQSAALVLADRSLTVRLQVTAAYPRLKKKRVTYSGGGYGPATARARRPTSAARSYVRARPGSSAAKYVTAQIRGQGRMTAARWSR